MEDFWLVLKGFAMGLAVAIPVGPIALLCMRRTLEQGFRFGFATGLGAAAADLFYSSIAALGIASVETVLLRYQLTFFLGFGIFLVALAARTAMHKTVTAGQDDDSTAGVFTAFASGFVLTATNPLTVLGIFAMFGGFAVGYGDRTPALVCGLVAGSATWWLILSGFVARVRHLFSPRTFQSLNLAAAALLATFAGYFLVRALMMGAPWLF